MTDGELKRAIGHLRAIGSDDVHYEVKACAHGLSKDIWETVSAFANTEGGVLILGLSERGGFTPAEGFETDRVCSQFLAGMGDAGRAGAKIESVPKYMVQRMEFEGTPLLVVTIDELDAAYKPCYKKDQGIKGGSYKRIDDADIPLSPNELYALETAGRVVDSDRAAVPGAALKDLDEAIYVQAIAKARQLMPKAMRGAEDNEACLTRLGFINVDGALSKAGLLAAGFYPQQFYPKLLVDVAAHAGTGKASVEGSRFLDRTLCVGALGDVIADAVAAVAKNLKRASYVRGAGRVDELEIPEEVIREAIANAVIHRDYDARFDGEAVAVDIYDDRVEVTSPGGLWGKTRHDLADGRSRCRNATLMTLLSLVPMPLGAGSPAEGNGSGIPLMLRACAQRGLREPSFVPRFDHFKVILWRPGAQAAGEGFPAIESHARISIELDSATLVQKALAEHGELSVNELQAQTGLSKSRLRNRLRKLLEKKQVVATAPPTSHNRKYRLA